ncbi:MAG: glycoside hydrolase family 26 protein [Muribaculaceae bacterium]|nr:glycoside hydrolase family 26 protein [Muribaculaceae bacterium]
MKYGILTLAVGLLLSSCTGSKKEKTEEAPSITPAAVLIAQLDSTSKAGKFYFGHSDDTAYGHEWKYETGRSDVKDITGEYPGLMNWDLGMLELDSTKNLDGVPFDFMAGEIIAQNARGGINAISWHLRNPLSGGDSWDVSASPLKELQENQALADTLDAWIGKVADFIGSLQDAEGNRVPVIFRPWHENTGTWFWWGAGNSTPEQYKDLWKRTRKIFDEKGIDNVVWAYSPDRVPSPEQYLVTYPGDEYVDILGSDIYHFGGEEGTDNYRESVKGLLPYVAEEAAKRGKLVAFTETGLESVVMDNWFTEVLLPLMNDIPVAYVCVWRNANKDEKPEHFYVPYPGHPAEADFKKFHDNPKTIFVK